MNLNYLKILPIIFLILSCNEKNQENENSEEESRDNEIILNVKPDETYQTIDNFGASDAWSIQFVGKWPDTKKNKIADLLFSSEKDEEGNPKGIGLSLWRFNLGAGSAGQGENSDISDEWRRAESFLQADGSYNWEKQEGQVWFAQAAKERGVENLLVFSNSPPVHITRNGKAYANNAISNLAKENYNEFADFLTQTIMGLQEKGLNVDYVSPVNEPQWDWSDGGQEGTPFNNNEIYGIAKALDQKVSDKNLSVKIDIPETAQIDYLYNEGDKPERGNQIEAFFDENSESYVGDLSNVSKTISGHSYFTTYPYSEAKKSRQDLNNKLENYPEIKYWMSEYCILEDNEEIKGNGRDLSMDPAMYMADIIHLDLTEAQASSWQWWLGVSPYDYKDGLIYIDKQKNDGNFYESKLLWALGNYSHFIRPGFNRIKTELNTSEDQLLHSAYSNPENDEIIVVLTNRSNSKITLNLTKENQNIGAAKAYITSSDKDLETHPVEDEIQLPPRSIVTLVTQ